MRQPGEVRRQRILAVLQARGSARVSDLAEELEVSVVTVRRDVEDLARAGKLRRGHGVARSVVPVEHPEPAVVEGGAVALVVPERHTYLYETLHGARTALEEAGLRVVLHVSPKGPSAERPIVDRVVADRMSGLLIAPRWRNEDEEFADYEWMAEVDVPMVIMERRPRRGSKLGAFESVCSDHWYGTYLAVDHLVQLGHRRIVLAARDDSPTARAIRVAFREIAASRPEIEDWTIVLSAPEAGAVGEEPPDFAAVLKERQATAAILHGDVDGLMLVQQLADAGVRVPGDCSIVAYDDVVAALGSPPLTAVAPPKAEVGRVAAELLLDRLARPGAWLNRRLELIPELKVRGSTDRLTD